jgi:hypothetical protein
MEAIWSETGGMVCQKDITVIINSPNPFRTYTVIKMPSPQHKLTISVIDMLGRVVQKEDLNSTGASSDTFIFTAKNLQRGVYKYIIRGDDFKYSNKR